MSTEPQFYDGWIEPESAANTNYQPVYPHNHITQTPSGHSFEMDDTPTRERIRLQHRSGTFTEIHPNGDEVHKIFGDGYTITLGNHNIGIGVEGGSNKCNITIYGDVNLNVKGDMNQEIEGDYNLRVKGYYSQTVDKTTTVTSAGDMRVTAGGAVGGALRINTGDHVYINGDLVVEGEVTATKITSQGRIDAATGIGAGPLGLVTSGGVSAGYPVPGLPMGSPMTPAEPGVVTAGVAVISPMIIGTTQTYGTILMDPLGGVPTVRTLFNAHKHITTGIGKPTLIPIPLMPLP